MVFTVQSAIQSACALAELTQALRTRCDPEWACTTMGEIALPGDPVYEAYARLIQSPRTEVTAAAIAVALAPAIAALEETVPGLESIAQIKQDLADIEAGHSLGFTRPRSFFPPGAPHPPARELVTRFRNATTHQVLSPLDAALKNLQLLEAAGLPEGSPALEHARKARENLLRIAAFMSTLSALPGAAAEQGSQDPAALQAWIDGLFDWRPSAIKEAAAEPDHTSALDPREARILYAEDDNATAEAVIMLMEMEGFKSFRWVENAAAALAVFDEAEAEGLPIQTVVSDFRMPPGVDGVTMVREMRRNHPALPVVFTTGSFDEVNNLLTADERNDSRIIPKPFEMDALIQALTEVLQRNIH